MTPRTDLAIVDGGLDHPAVQALISEHLAHMASMTPIESMHAMNLDGLRGADITFWSVWDGDVVAGCGALKALSPTHGEVKSMRTADAYRRRGVATRLLDHIIGVARRRGYDTLSLETGSGPDFQPARSLYERHGFAYCAPFADYRDDPLSSFMTRNV